MKINRLLVSFKYNLYQLCMFFFKGKLAGRLNELLENKESQHSLDREFGTYVAGDWKLLVSGSF